MHVPPSNASPETSRPAWSRLRRIALLLLLAIVLGIAFAGYLSPDMRLQWENLMALCGF